MVNSPAAHLRAARNSGNMTQYFMNLPQRLGYSGGMPVSYWQFVDNVRQYENSLAQQGEGRKNTGSQSMLKAQQEALAEQLRKQLSLADTLQSLMSDMNYYKSKANQHLGQMDSLFYKYLEVWGESIPGADEEESRRVRNAKLDHITRERFYHYGMLNCFNALSMKSWWAAHKIRWQLA